MKNNFLKILAAFAIFAVVLVSSTLVFADEADILVTALDENADYTYMDNDYFNANETVLMNQLEIDGNAFVFAKDVEIENVIVDGSLFVAGQNVELKNVTVRGDIFAAGHKVTIESSEVKNIYAAGQFVTIEDETTVKRDGYLAGQAVTIDAQMDTLSIGANALTIESNAKINKVDGELGTEAKISSDAIVESNNLTVVEVKEEVAKVPSVLDRILEVIGKIVKLIVLSLIIAFIVVKANRAERIKNYTAGKIATNGAIGFGLCIGLIMLSVMLLFTVILTLVGVMGIFAYISMIMCAAPAGCVVVALKLLNDKEANMKNTLLFTVLVAACLVVVSMIPVIGGIVKFLISLVGMGTLFDIIFLKEKDEKKEVVNVTEE